MPANKSSIPPSDSLQDIFDDPPYIEQDFLFEVMFYQDEYFRVRMDWETSAAILDKMLEKGIPTQDGRCSVRRVEDERRFEVIDNISEEEIREGKKEFERWLRKRGWTIAKWTKVSEQAGADAAKRKARRISTLSRLSLPE